MAIPGPPDAKWTGATYDKHWPRYNLSWEQARKGTIGHKKAARYHPKLKATDIERLESSYYTKGIKLGLNGVEMGYWIVDADEIIGASQGRDTKTIIVKVSPLGRGWHFHGHPINEQEKQQHLRDFEVMP